MIGTWTLVLSVVSWSLGGGSADQGRAASLQESETVTFEIPLDVLADKIQGGLLGQILGNLNGLPHENQYIAEPGNVAEYTPALPDGARTDDDTDIEWVYIIEMQRTGQLLLPYAAIVDAWKRHINEKIWCANLYARQLMEIGLAPPLTGRLALNPWSDFNISGQFVAEAFGLVSPGMPQTAARLGLHYTHVTIDGEPAQATQLFTSMIATAFTMDDVEAIISAGRKCIDPLSVIAQVVTDVRQWHQQHPADWRQTRQRIRDKYTQHGGQVRDSNGHELNTAAIIASLLYGRGDFRETMRLAFNFGWDADCNAATAGSVIGVMRGRRWMESQGWVIAEPYRNVTRPGLPEDETIRRYGQRLIEIAMQVVKKNGGEIVPRGDSSLVRIRRQEPIIIERLMPHADRLRELREELLPRIETDLAGSEQDRARAAYLAICLGQAERLKRDQPARWESAVQALRSYRGLLAAMRNAPGPAGEQLRQNARAVGALPAPSKKAD